MVLFSAAFPILLSLLFLVLHRLRNPFPAHFSFSVHLRLERLTFSELYMSLKAELETWAAALKAYDEGDFERSLPLFSVCYHLRGEHH
jgi:hypothetical protein